MRQRLNTKPEADKVDRHDEILQCGVSEQKFEDVEDVVSIVGQGVGMNDSVVVYREDTSSYEENSLRQ